MNVIHEGRASRTDLRFGRLSKVAGLLLATCSAVSLTTPARGQSIPPNSTTADAHDETADPGITEIVVTAEKRVERLRDVPISVQVVQGEQLEQRNLNSLQELSKTVPGLHVSPGGFSDNLFIRGLGSGLNVAFDQSVSMFVDDVYHGRSRLNGATFLDLERVEVLKGPQSTFFGNNAIAGALNIVTRKPSDTFNGWARALYGMHGQYAVEGAVGGPLTDTVGVRIAATYNGGSGWLDNINTGKKVPRRENLAGRATLSFEPTDALEFTFKVEGGKNQTDGVGAGGFNQFVNCPPPAPLTPASPFAGSCARALELGLPIGLHNNKTAGVAGQETRLSTFEPVLTTNYTLGDGHVLTSVTAYSYYKFRTTADNGQIPEFTQSYIDLDETYDQFSQEIRLSSPLGKRLQYLLGAYYQDDTLDTGAQASFPIFDFLFQVIPPFNPLVPYLPTGAISRLRMHEKTYSVFGALDWHLTKALLLKAGLRHSWVEKSTNYSSTLGTAIPFGSFIEFPPAVLPVAEAFYGSVNPGVRSQFTDSAWMPSAALQYQLNPDAMLYASYSRGFKAGGVTVARQSDGDIAPVRFLPETVNAFELGAKGSFLDKRLQVNLAVFRSNFDNQQVLSARFDPVTQIPTFVITNAAASRSQGVELEAQMRFSRQFRLGFNVTYLDSVYRRYPDASPLTLQAFCRGLSQADFAATPQCATFPFPVPAVTDLSGKRTPFAPRWSGSLSAGFSQPLGGGRQFEVSVDPYFTSSYSPSVGNDPYIPKTNSYVRLDARLTLEQDDGRWAIDLIGKNLTNKIIVISQPFVTLAGKEEPWNVSLQLRTKF